MSANRGIMKIVFLVLGSLFLGFVIYKLSGYKFTNNSKVMLNLLVSELNGIYIKLNDSKISESEQKILNERAIEINNILEQFFGKKLIV